MYVFFHLQFHSNSCDLLILVTIQILRPTALTAQKQK